jgi:hypothetical protein
MASIDHLSCLIIRATLLQRWSPYRLTVLFNCPVFAQNEGVSPALPLLREQPLAAPLSCLIVKRDTRSALLKVLRKRGLYPDGLGEIQDLRDADARAIRNEAGYTALANRVWRCPPLPDADVWNTPWGHLSDALPRAYGHGPGEWVPWRSHPRYDKDSGLRETTRKSLRIGGNRSH